jgi:hypothetical protein
MSFGHRGFSQLHNLRKRQKDGALIGRAQGTHQGALCGWGSPSHYVTRKGSASSTRKLERKSGLLSFHLGWNGLHFGNGVHHQNNVLIEGHNRLVRILSKSRIVWVKAHELPCVDGSIIHFMLGKTWERECMGGYGMMCIMRVLEEFEPKEATNLVTSSKCIK